MVVEGGRSCCYGGWEIGEGAAAAGVGPSVGMGAVREVVAGVVVVVVPLVGVARLAVQLVARLVVQVPGEGGGGRRASEGGRREAAGLIG